VVGVSRDAHGAVARRGQQPLETTCHLAMTTSDDDAHHRRVPASSPVAVASCRSRRSTDRVSRHPAAPGWVADTKTTVRRATQASIRLALGQSSPRGGPPGHSGRPARSIRGDRGGARCHVPQPVVECSGLAICAPRRLVGASGSPIRVWGIEFAPSTPAEGLVPTGADRAACIRAREASRLVSRGPPGTGSCSGRNRGDTRL
jgi:hypothetical protein